MSTKHRSFTNHLLSVFVQFSTSCNLFTLLTFDYKNNYMTNSKSSCSRGTAVSIIMETALITVKEEDKRKDNSER
jgi:hypothetical protein